MIISGHGERGVMKTKRYTVAEAQRFFERLVREAEHGADVYIIDENKRVVKLVAATEDKKPKPGAFE